MPRKKKQKPEAFNVRVYVDADGVATLGFVSRCTFKRKIHNSYWAWVRGNRRKMARLLGIPVHED